MSPARLSPKRMPASKPSPAMSAKLSPATISTWISKEGISHATETPRQRRFHGFAHRVGHLGHCRAGPGWEFGWGPQDDAGIWPHRNHFALRRINRLIKFEAVLLNRQVDRSLAESARATGIGGWVDWRIDGKCYAVTAIGMFDKPGSNRTPIGDPGYRHRTTKCRIDRLLQCSVVIHPQHEMLHPDAGPSPTILRVDPCASTRMSQSRKRIGR